MTAHRPDGDAIPAATAQAWLGGSQGPPSRGKSKEAQWTLFPCGSSPAIAVKSCPALLAIPLDGDALNGDLELPPRSLGLVVFVHGSGSGRHSPRNRSVAEKLRAAGFGTLLLDLQTPVERAEAEPGGTNEDLAQLARRLVLVVRWIKEQPDTAHLPIGLYGASTGGAVALAAAAVLGPAVGAVVLRGGRPDLVADLLPRVSCPVQLIVGSHDKVVLSLNEAAYSRLHCIRQLRVVPGATHLFEEPGSLDQVARWSSTWFTLHLCHEVLP
jgi:putative phosphoribosyl transferase